MPFFHNTIPASITGIPGHAVENVLIESLEIIYPGGANKGYAYLPLYRLNDVPEQISSYSESSTFGELPAWALYVRHVDGLTLKNVNLILKNSDFRPAFVIDNVSNLKIENPKIIGHGEHAQIILKDVWNEEIDEKAIKYGLKKLE